MSEVVEIYNGYARVTIDRGVDQVVHIEAQDRRFEYIEAGNPIIVTWRGPLVKQTITVYRDIDPPAFDELIGVTKIMCGELLNISYDAGLFRVHFVPFHPSERGR